MRPGPQKWATNDNHPAGGDPWSGLNTKVEPSSGHRDQGWEPEEEPAAEYLNWLLNRYGILLDQVARLQVSRWDIVDSSAILAGYTLDASCHYVDLSGYIRGGLFLYNAVANQVVERQASNGLVWSTPASSPVDGIANAITNLDADADDIDQRMVVITGTVPDRVRYAVGRGGGAWATAAFGAPTLNWQSIGCDKNTAGGANARWIIGDDAGGGNGVIYTSIAGSPPNFANVGAYPAIAEPVIFIGHTCHPVGALGPQDTGNPSWLILTTNRAINSPNGTSTWFNFAHGFAGAPTKKCAAYSRTSGRWVVVGAGAAAGDIYYSDNNGASWTGIVGALSPAPTGSLSIACDGYGTFVVGELAAKWISVDEGMNWTRISTSLTGGAGGGITEAMVDENVDVDQHHSTLSGFFTADHNPAGGGLLQVQRSLVY